MNEHQARLELAAVAQRIWERGWVANHDGNLSLRLGRGRLLCTPTGVSKRGLAPDSLLVVDESGRVLAGKLRPFSELNLHLAYLQARPDAGAVIHAHPPTATGLGVAGVALDQPLLPEAVVSLGPVIPTLPLALPGGDALAAAAPYLDEHDALLLAGNGVLVCGADLEQAYLRLELVEHLARIALVAHQLGGARPLPAHYLPPLLAARARAGLGRGGTAVKAVPAQEARGRATTLPASRPPAGERQPGELEQIVRAEIKRVLDGS
jgi:L-fuculose-phosphate aldolase